MNVLSIIALVMYENIAFHASYWIVNITAIFIHLASLIISGLLIREILVNYHKILSNMSMIYLATIACISQWSIFGLHDMSNAILNHYLYIDSILHYANNFFRLWGLMDVIEPVVMGWIALITTVYIGMYMVLDYNNKASTHEKTVQYTKQSTWYAYVLCTVIVTVNITSFVLHTVHVKEIMKQYALANYKKSHQYLTKHKISIPNSTQTAS